MADRKTVKDAEIKTVQELHGDYYSSEKVSEVTGLKVASLPHLVATRTLTPVRFGGVYAFDQRMVEEYAEKHRQDVAETNQKREQAAIQKREDDRKAALADQLVSRFPGSKAETYRKLPIEVLEALAAQEGIKTGA